MKYFVRAILATIIAALLSSCSYNSMVEADENINAQWAKVENQYQRRADLVPNLVNTVKGYAAHESETLEAVIAARSKATQITVDPANLTEENLQKYQEAQGNCRVLWENCWQSPRTIRFEGQSKFLGITSSARRN